MICGLTVSRDGLGHSARVAVQLSLPHGEARPLCRDNPQSDLRPGQRPFLSIIMQNPVPVQQLGARVEVLLGHAGEAGNVPGAVPHHISQFDMVSISMDLRREMNTPRDAEDLPGQRLTVICNQEVALGVLARAGGQGLEVVAKLLV